MPDVQVISAKLTREKFVLGIVLAFVDVLTYPKVRARLGHFARQLTGEYGVPGISCRGREYRVVGALLFHGEIGGQYRLDNFPLVVAEVVDYDEKYGIAFTDLRKDLSLHELV